MAKRGGFRKGDKMMVCQSGLSVLQQKARAHRISSRDLRVLLEMLANTGYDNQVMVGHAELAKLTGIDINTISKCVGTLREEGIVERLNERRGWYRINPKYVWKGLGEAHLDALAREAEEAYFAKYEELAKQRSEDDERRSVG